MVATNRTDTEPPDQAAALGTISSDYPGWETWAGGLAGLLYAMHRDPQIVVRSTTLDGLRAEIERTERERGLR
jgi:hypothetical protein